MKGEESKEREEWVDAGNPLWQGLGDSSMYHQAHHHGSFECLILAKALAPRCRVHTTQGWRLRSLYWQTQYGEKEEAKPLRYCHLLVYSPLFPSLKRW